jgi:ankyrin repeat protein
MGTAASKTPVESSSTLTIAPTATGLTGTDPISPQGGLSPRPLTGDHKLPISDEKTNGESKEEEKTSVDDMTPLQALFYACDSGNKELVRRAVEAGADVNTADVGPDTEDKTETAESKARKEKEKKKKKKGSDDQLTKNVTITGDFPIHKATEKGHYEVVNLLFFLQADLEAKNRLGSTALHRAVSTGQKEIVTLLLSKGAKIDATTSAGNNVLHIAAFCGSVEIAKLILDSRPDAIRLLGRRNLCNLTPLDYARKKNVQQLFESYGRPSSGDSLSGSARASGRLTNRGGGSEPNSARPSLLAAPNTDRSERPKIEEAPVTDNVTRVEAVTAANHMESVAEDDEKQAPAAQQPATSGSFNVPTLAPPTASASRSRRKQSGSGQAPTDI